MLGGKCKAFLRFLSAKVGKEIKSAVLSEMKTPLVITSHSKRPKLKPGQLRIGVHCCAVNASDYLMCQDLSESKPPVMPFVPGFEVSGQVLEIAPRDGNDSDSEGEYEEISVGDRVLTLNKDSFGGFSQECVANISDTFVVPNSVSYKMAAAIGDSYGTALLGLSRRAKIQEHEIVMITAAAGGLGLAAVDIAANVYKTKVIGVCGSEDRASLVREKGAWSAFTYKDSRALREKVLDLSEGKGADVVFEAVGGAVFTHAINCVSVEGKVIVAGFSSRDIPQLAMSDLLRLPSFSLIGVSLGNYRTNKPSIFRQAVRDSIELFEQGLISPHVSEVLPLDRVNEALSHLAENKTTGKVILEMD